MTSTRADMYLWKRKWSLPDGFESKKEFKAWLAKNGFAIITDPHYSRKNSWHIDIFQYDKDGRIEKKSHCRVGNDFGSSFLKALEIFPS